MRLAEVSLEFFVSAGVKHTHHRHFGCTLSHRPPYPQHAISLRKQQAERLRQSEQLGDAEQRRQQEKEAPEAEKQPQAALLQAEEQLRESSKSLTYQAVETGGRAGGVV